MAVVLLIGYVLVDGVTASLLGRTRGNLGGVGVINACHPDTSLFNLCLFREN